MSAEDHRPLLDVINIVIATVLLLSNSVTSNRVYVTDDSVITEGISGERWRQHTAEGRHFGLRPSVNLPHLNNPMEAKRATITHDICHFAKKDGRQVYEVCWRHPADLSILPDNWNFYGKIPTIPVYLGLEQSSGFNYPMLPYPFTFAKDENAISAISASSRQSTCGAGPTKTSTVEEDRVVGGTEAQPNSWPGVGLLRFDGQFFCGGTLISPTKILTAAHCVDDLWPWDFSRLTVDLGVHVQSPDSDAQLVKRVRKVARHLLFNTNTLANDVAVLTLDSPVTYTSTISPVCLPPLGSSDLYTGQSASIVGWGRTSYQGSLPSALQQATTAIVGNDDCTVSYADVITIRSSMLCATSLGIGSCHGDSGGPIFVRSAPGAPWVQAGIVSFGVECANDQFPSVYTRVSSFLPFIMKHMLL